MNRRRALILLLAGAATAGCGGEPPVRTLRMAYPHSLLTLDPHAHADTVTGTVLSAIYEPLVIFEPGLPVRAQLADSWTTPDDRTWRIHVRDGVRFHDGTPLQPLDVVASIERARASAVAGHQLEDIVEIREEPDRIVEITTRRPAPLLLTRLETVAIVPRDFNPSVPVGTGPFHWVVGSLQGPVLVRRWHDYWGAPARFGEVSIEFVAYEEELAALLNRDRLDVVSSVSYRYLERHSPQVGWRVERSNALAVTYLGLNLRVPPLHDRALREAIELAVDRPALVKEVFPPGTAEPASALVPPAIFGFSPEHRLPPADPAQARALIAAVPGDGDRRLRLDCADRLEPVARQLATFLAETGLRIEVNPEPYEALYRRLTEGTTELFLFNWSFRVADASLFLDTFVHSRDPLHGLGTFNAAGIDDPEIDELIDLAAGETNGRLRLERLRAVLARVAEIKAYQPLFEPRYLSLVRSGIVVDGPTLIMQRPQDFRTD